MTPDQIQKLLPHMTPEERAEVEALLAQDVKNNLWRPQIGPQLKAFESEADIVGYGGAAGGGKTDLLVGLTLTQHKRVAIFRREKAQTERVIQRMTELLGDTNGYNSQKGIWQLGNGRLVEFGGLDNPGDERRWQGRDHDLKAYDEVTEMREAQVRYTMGWNRSADPSVRSRILFVFNPPTTAEGRWVIAFFAPWLDKQHPNPAKDGELRWFSTIDGKDEEVPDGRRFVLVNGRRVYAFDDDDHRPEEIIRPKSRTFIASRVTDNAYYMATDYISTLQSMPEPLRSQMLSGDFRAGMKDDEMQVIPTAWIEQAQARWEAKVEKGPMDSIGSDPSRGGADNHVIARRHGTWFDELVAHPGLETPDGPTGAAQVLIVRRDGAPVHVDIIGWGASVGDFLRSNNVQTVFVNASSKSYEVANEGGLRFANYRAQLVWRMREALDPHNPHPLYLPPDRVLLSDLAAYRWKLTPAGIQIGDKAEMKKLLGRSPDRGDAVCYALVSTMKQDTVARLMPAPVYDPYRELG